MEDYTKDELREMIVKYLKEEMTEEEPIEKDEDMKIPVTKDAIRELFCPKVTWRDVLCYLENHYEEMDDLPLEVISYFNNRKRKKARANSNRKEIVCDLVKRYFELNPDNLCSFSYLMCNLGGAVTTYELEYALSVQLKDFMTCVTIHEQSFWYAPELLNIKRAKLCTPLMEEEGI